MKPVYVTSDIGNLSLFFNSKVKNRYDVVELAKFLYWQFGLTPTNDPIFVVLKSSIFLVKLKNECNKIWFEVFLVKRFNDIFYKISLDN